MITANNATRSITEAQAAALRMADGEFELSPALTDKLQGLFGQGAKILSSASLSFALRDDRVTIGLIEEMASQLPSVKLKIVRQMERNREPYETLRTYQRGQGGRIRTITRPHLRDNRLAREPRHRGPMIR